MKIANIDSDHDANLAGSTGVIAAAAAAALLGTPALTLGTANAAGTATTAVRTDATILAFDATAPSTQAIGDSAAAGTAVVAARRDHKHAITNPLTTQDDLWVGGASGAPGRLAKGTDSQVLTVDPTTHHLIWATPGAGSSPLTTKGDLWGFSTVDARIPIGTDNYVLTADSAQTLGLKWAAGGGGGMTNPMTAVGDLIVGGTVTGGVAAPTALAAGTATYVLTANGASAAPSWQAPPGGGSITLYHDTTTRTVTNTVTETTVFPNQSIAGGTLGNYGSIRVTLIMNLNHGVAGTLTLRVKHGTTVIATLDCTAGGVNASKDGVVRALIVNLGAQNSQSYEMDVNAMDGTTGGGADYGRAKVGTAAADTSATGNFSITAQWGSASASLTYTQYAALIELLV